jgi:hypothetical protein
VSSDSIDLIGALYDIKGKKVITFDDIEDIIKEINK